MKKAFLSICYIFFAAACVDDYEIPDISSEGGLLVVEGFINIDGPTTIQLSRTVTLGDDGTKSSAEDHSAVTIEGEDNTNFELIEYKNGSYRSESLSLPVGRKYRIRIKTSNAKEYLSDFSEAKQAAPIDSITRELDFPNRGMRFYAYTHDPANSSQYYFWDYDETWEYHTYYQYNILEYKNGQVVYRDPYIFTYTCWMTTPSTEIFTASTERLSGDVINNFKLQFIPARSEKLVLGYSILLKQHAITREEFDYLNELKKNTETRGSIFDAQPSQLQGNIHALIDPLEPVLGFVGAHGITEKRRVFIAGGQLPPWFDLPSDGLYPTDSECGGSNLPYNQIIKLAEAGVLVPFGYLPDHYGFTDARCVDCRVRGGTNIKPDYWTN